MSGARSLVIAGVLALIALAPGALADCGFNHNGGSTSPPTFTTQATPAGPSPITIVGLVLVPIGLIGGIVAVVRLLAPKPVTGHWAATPTQWVWVEDKK